MPKTSVSGPPADMRRSVYDPDKDGRIEKDAMEWTADKLLKGAGAGSDPTEIDVPCATKEFFVPVTYASGLTVFGDFPAALMDGAGDLAHIVFKVPHDFTSITNAELVLIGNDVNNNAHFDIYSDYGADDEAYNTHSEQALNQTPAVTQNDIKGIDISGVLSNLDAGDYVGIKVTWDLRTWYIVGIRLRYS